MFILPYVIPATNLVFDTNGRLELSVFSPEFDLEKRNPRSRVPNKHVLYNLRVSDVVPVDQNYHRVILVKDTIGLCHSFRLKENTLRHKSRANQLECLVVGSDGYLGVGKIELGQCLEGMNFDRVSPDIDRRNHSNQSRIVELPQPHSSSTLCPVKIGQHPQILSKVPSDGYYIQLVGNGGCRTYPGGFTLRIKSPRTAKLKTEDQLRSRSRPQLLGKRPKPEGKEPTHTEEHPVDSDTDSGQLPPGPENSQSSLDEKVVQTRGGQDVAGTSQPGSDIPYIHSIPQRPNGLIGEFQNNAKPIAGEFTDRTTKHSQSIGTSSEFVENGHRHSRIPDSGLEMSTRGKDCPLWDVQCGEYCTTEIQPNICDSSNKADDSDIDLTQGSRHVRHRKPPPFIETAIGQVAAPNSSSDRHVPIRTSDPSTHSYGDLNICELCTSAREPITGVRNISMTNDEETFWEQLCGELGIGNECIGCQKRWTC